LYQSDHSISRWIAALYRSRKGYVNKRLEPYGIGSGQFIYLMSLYWKDGASQEQISDHLKIDKTTTAKALKKLECGGFVIRETDEADKRTYKVRLTQKARDLMPVILDIVNQWENTVTSGITDDEVRVLEGLLNRMDANACQIAKKDSSGGGGPDAQGDAR
jgi:DNA-binding MarR family transcriptional regulator